ncbi:hypothetical protein ACTFIR_007549 [Dictyostelium discoideum]
MLVFTGIVMLEIVKEISIDFLSLPKTMYALNGYTVEVNQVCVIFPSDRGPRSTKVSPFQTVYGFNPTPVNYFNSLTKTRIPMDNIKKIARDNILDAQIIAQNEWLREEISMPEPEVMDEASYEVEIDTDYEELVREYWNNVQKKQLNSRRERENATTEAIDHLNHLYSLKKFKILNHCNQLLQDNKIPTTQIKKTNQRKSRNQNTVSDDELDISLQIKTTRSGRKVTPKIL